MKKRIICYFLQCSLSLLAADSSVMDIDQATMMWAQIVKNNIPQRYYVDAITAKLTDHCLVILHTLLSTASQTHKQQFATLLPQLLPRDLLDKAVIAESVDDISPITLLSPASFGKPIWSLNLKWHAYSTSKMRIKSVVQPAIIRYGAGAIRFLDTSKPYSPRDVSVITIRPKLGTLDESIVSKKYDPQRTTGPVCSFNDNGNCISHAWRSHGYIPRETVDIISISENNGIQLIITDRTATKIIGDRVKEKSPIWQLPLDENESVIKAAASNGIVALLTMRCKDNPYHLHLFQYTDDGLHRIGKPHAVPIEFEDSPNTALYAFSDGCALVHDHNADIQDIPIIAREIDYRLFEHPDQSCIHTGLPIQRVQALHYCGSGIINDRFLSLYSAYKQNDKNPSLKKFTRVELYEHTTSLTEKIEAILARSAIRRQHKNARNDSAEPSNCILL